MTSRAPSSTGPTATTGPVVLALDVGGTKLATAVLDSSATLDHRSQRPTDTSDAETLYTSLLDMANATRRAATSEVVAVGVGCGGPARHSHRLVSPLNIKCWRDFPLRDRLVQDLGLPVFVDNDAKALALAEGWCGAAAESDNFLAMVVSTGIGGGIVMNRRLLEGADGNAGHVGHVFVEPDGHPDAHGVRGLLEGSASGTAIASVLGAPAATANRAMREQVGVYVGRAVASTINLLDLQLAVVGGSVALGYGGDFFSAAQRTIDELCHVNHSRGARIIPAGHGERGPLVGAGAVAWNGLGRDVLRPGRG